MGLFDIFKKKERDYEDYDYIGDEYEGYGDNRNYESDDEYQYPADLYYDDETYIRQFEKVQAGAWVQYEIELDARGYGWDNMLEWADYMAEADIMNVSQVTTGSLPNSEDNITEAFHANNDRCTGMAEVAEEKGVLSIAGISSLLSAPMKIVWFNNTNMMRMFTTVDDSLVIEKYTETCIRRTFHTDYEMKLGRPLAQ